MRNVVLPVSALIIMGLVWYKQGQAPQTIDPATRRMLAQRRPAPPFQLHDLHSKVFRLDRYLGRHKLLIVFVDANSSVADNPQLQLLKSGFDRLSSDGAKIIAIASSTPWANREALGNPEEIPFHLLSDADFGVAHRWGVMIDDDPPTITPHAFVVDRAGVIVWSRAITSNPTPQPANTPIPQPTSETPPPTRTPQNPPLTIEELSSALSSAR